MMLHLIPKDPTGRDIVAVLADAEILGFTTRHVGFGSIALAEILAGHGMTGPITMGPVQYTDVEVGDG